MARSTNLDIVAPDDQLAPVQNSPALETDKKTQKPESLVPPKKPSPSSSKKTTTPPSDKPAASYRDKVYEILGHTTHSLSSMLINPHVFSFSERDENEEIILVLRQHWFTNVKWVLSAIFMIFIPGLLAASPLYDTIPGNFRFILTIFWYLITVAFAFEKFLAWYFNVYIITDERVVDIDFNNLLNKRFSEAKISMIQDVTSSIRGLAQTMFNFGTIQIQTAAEIPEISFGKVPNPEKVIKVLQQLRSEEEQEALEGRVR